MVVTRQNNSSPNLHLRSVSASINSANALLLSANLCSNSWCYIVNCVEFLLWASSFLFGRGEQCKIAALDDYEEESEHVIG
ncbi:hypothetical protein TNIN_336521 [Trichonephila inaurata madagascariensis]|uniref:Uncharacterized protein n=1 Tax=Trichonephila inaurata madagascariensis TaxID=2747483 RepID=A0A8X6YB13_9ARAC|nr:hypothetical protein TNIN_336521 [Trichonephila inaurata madagascariensis]